MWQCTAQRETCNLLSKSKTDLAPLRNGLSKCAEICGYTLSYRHLPTSCLCCPIFSICGQTLCLFLISHRLPIKCRRQKCSHLTLIHPLSPSQISASTVLSCS